MFSLPCAYIPNSYVHILYMAMVWVLLRPSREALGPLPEHLPGGPKKQKQLNGNSHSSAFVFLDHPVVGRLVGRSVCDASVKNA